MTDEHDVPEDPIPSELVREDPSFADVVIQFVEGLGERVKAMEDAIRAADFEALRVAAQQLKCGGGGYGYPVLAERAAELERQARMQALHNCQKVLDELKQLCLRLVVAEDK